MLNTKKSITVTLFHIIENFDEDDEVKGNCEITLEIFYTVHTLQV